MGLLGTLRRTRDADALLVAFELHSAEEIRATLDAGVDARVPIQGKSPINWLTEMYSRGDDFPKCVQIPRDGRWSRIEPVR